jgi:hypothetical protein
MQAAPEVSPEGSPIMDLTQTIIAKSDQINAEDLLGGPQTFTVTDVRMGDSEQPVCIVLAELPKGRTFKPSKTVLRILVMAWGADSDAWPKGARMTLYRDESVKWAGQAVGGIRVSHLSHIDDKLKVALAESKGKKVLHTVQPLPDAPPTGRERLRAANAAIEAEPIPEKVPAGRINAGTVARIQILCKELGIEDRDTRLFGIGRVIGRDVDSTKELTQAEGHAVIESLEQRKAAAMVPDEIPGQEPLV